MNCALRKKSAGEGSAVGGGENAIGGSAFESTFSATEIWVRTAVITKNTTLKVQEE